MPAAVRGWLSCRGARPLGLGQQVQSFAGNRWWVLLVMVAVAAALTVAAFLATEMGFMGFIAAAYGIQASLRLRSEETSLHAEPLLATGLTRLRWAGSHITVAALGTAALLLISGLAAGLADGTQTGNMSAVGRVLLAAAVQIPAAWILVGVVVLLFGFLPQFVRAGWIVLVAFLLLAELGPLLKLSPTLMDVSPFAHLPKLPGGEFAVSPLIVLTVIAVLLTAVGLAGFRRRDVD